MKHSAIRQLGQGYTYEVDAVDERGWNELLQEFDDANIYQTWQYAAVVAGARNTSRLIVKNNGTVVAVAQARMAKIPFLKIGIAYVLWGPVWRRRGTEASPEIFRQAVRALRNEFACRRGLVLRLSPLLFQDDAQMFSGMLADEAFSPYAGEIQKRTILMDLRPPLEDLHAGMGGMWKRNLKQAEKHAMEVTEGTEDALFGSFIGIYKEMVSRKKFVEPNDINQFRMIQAQLPEKLKMKVLLCNTGDGVGAGVITSAIGNTAVYLFGATSNAGMKLSGSYLLQWKMIQRLKQEGTSVYNLHGINPAKNPGTYKFKRDLGGSHGKDVYFLGRFDSTTNVLSSSFVECGETLRSAYKKFKGQVKTGWRLKLRPDAAQQGVSLAPPAQQTTAGSLTNAR